MNPLPGSVAEVLGSAPAFRGLAVGGPRWLLKGAAPRRPATSLDFAGGSGPTGRRQRRSPLPHAPWGEAPRCCQGTGPASGRSSLELGAEEAGRGTDWCLTFGVKLRWGRQDRLDGTDRFTQLLCSRLLTGFSGCPSEEGLAELPETGHPSLQLCRGRDLQ